MATTTYKVTGMTCEHCVSAVTDELMNVAGVREVAVDLVPGGQSSVTITSEAPLSDATVDAALDEAGVYERAGFRPGT